MSFFQKDYKPKKITGAYDNKYIEYKSEGNEQLPNKEYIEGIRPYLYDIMHDPRTLGE